AEHLKHTAEKQRARELANAQDFANVLGTLLLRFERKVGEKGRLYGSVTNADIAERIEQAVELTEELDKRKVLLQEPIKSLGSYEVSLHIHPDVSASVTVEVVGDQGETAADFYEEITPAEETEAASAQEETEAVSAQPDGEY
ncbi:MAG: 50S ribosomal protein L9, partial [Ardenticatenaceae bacterium]